MLAAALEYAGRGVPVFPVWWPIGGRCGCGEADCTRPAKHPIGAVVPHGLHDATTVAAIIRRWWTRHLSAGIATPTTWCTVLDVDPRHGGDLTLAELEQQCGALPVTPRVLSGGGGRHLFFAPVSGLRNSVGKIGPGVDVRAAGAYVLLPPSAHVSGATYRDDPDAPLFETTLASMPTWLLALAFAPASSSNGDGEPGEATDWADLLAGAPDGQRHAVAARIAGHFLGLGITAPEVEQILLGFAARCSPPFPAAEARQIVRDLAVKDAQRSASAEDSGDPAVGAPAWSLHDGADPWEFPAIAELIESLLPAKGIVWWGGLPKRFKSLLALYVCLAIACRRSAVAKKFLVRTFPKILYVSREDGGARLDGRRADILSAWTERPEPGAIVFVIRPHLDLANPEHITWLRNTCRSLGITMVVLDTWTALSPSADPLGAHDQARLVAVVVQLCEDIDGLVIVVDHSRKNRPDGQPLSSADIFGPPQKWQAAEHVVMLDVVEAGRRIEVFVEGKDMETRRFFLAVTPPGSGEEKFSFAGSVEDLADARRATGARNRDAVLAILRDAGAALATGEIVALLKAKDITLSADSVLRHVSALLKAGQASQAGKGKTARYSALPVSPQAPCASMDEANG
ncbi:MAG: bifunctional DNA primase/polymerase [Candidatus Rokubacteria bacterium]|nr:bifunctional DNA primase/polymerase [Candidatus Rokubacteria bacterium]MBI3105479.1 bifunctional DNA primase/polymerase [Candidatus Rokubacteria bacterium]